MTVFTSAGNGNPRLAAVNGCSLSCDAPTPRLAKDSPIPSTTCHCQQGTRRHRQWRTVTIEPVCCQPHPWRTSAATTSASPAWAAPRSNTREASTAISSLRALRDYPIFQASLSARINRSQSQSCASRGVNDSNTVRCRMAFGQCTGPTDFRR